MMATWVEEMFPPKFKFCDLLEAEEIRSVREGNRRDPKYYDAVLERYFLPNEHDGSIDIKREQATGVSYSNLETHEDEVEKDQKESHREKSEDKCLWNTNELNILRNSLKCSKLNTIRLTVLSRALQKDCERLKNNCYDQEQLIVKLNKRYSDVRKQNKSMKITCKALIEDAKCAEARLQDYQKQLDDILEDKSSTAKQVAKMQQDLDVLRKENKLLRLEIDKQSALLEKRLENQSTFLRSLYESEISELTEKLRECQRNFEKETNDHLITKKALVHLRLHFTHDSIGNPPN